MSANNFSANTVRVPKPRRTHAANPWASEILSELLRRKESGRYNSRTSDCAGQERPQRPPSLTHATAVSQPVVPYPKWQTQAEYLGWPAK